MACHCHAQSFPFSQATVIRRLIPGGLGRNSALFRHVGEGFVVRALAKMARHPVRAVPGQVQNLILQIALVIDSNSDSPHLYRFKLRRCLRTQDL